jgi:tetratricopeptide (TPR) repeat protein
MIDTPPNAATEKPWVRRLTLALVALSLLGPLAYKHAPREVARWHHAIAAERYSTRGAEEALRSMRQRCAGRPTTIAYTCKSPNGNARAGRYEEALEWCGKAREQGGHESELRNEKTENLWSLKRWNNAARAVEQAAAEASEAGTLDSDPQLLNSLAYARALANTELEEALRDINEAIALAGSDPALLDTRGFIQFRRGELDSALRDLDNALQSLGVPAAAAATATNASETAGSQKPEPAKSEAAKKTANASPSEKSGQPKQLESKHGSPQSAAASDGWSVCNNGHGPRLLYHRMLILEKQGQEAKAEEDRKR